MEIGANDYVVKPFSIRELITRVKVQLRPAAEMGASSLRSGALELDRSKRQVRHNGQRVPLTATEFRLLEFLMSRPGIVFSREQLLNAIWGNNRAIIDRSVDVYILRLRKKLETAPAKPQLICSVRGFGYSFNADQASNEIDPVAAQA